ncbi:putative uncharacterized protein [Clostridium sp. CAG:352]|jgi:hypothetical protein|nr:putative uncharacterized protein [Clostridium sp. CAG:352]SCI90161.1 Uncharacterised protein [uncultured Ruminococcus sp.]
MKFENTEVFNFEGALRGMRNPMNSWDKKDSYQGRYHYIIGENDLKLTQTLIKAGSEHRKFMRQIFVSVDITAPLYWWSEYDTYKIGTTANSCSKMHKIHSKEFCRNDFSFDELNKESLVFLDTIIAKLEELRLKYIETKDKQYWYAIIQLLPSSYNQKRTVTMTYENVFNMIHQRMNHKLNEWSGKDDSSKPNFISWTKKLPYAEELLFIEKENKGEN